MWGFVCTMDDSTFHKISYKRLITFLLYHQKSRIPIRKNDIFIANSFLNSPCNIIHTLLILLLFICITGFIDIRQMIAVQSICHLRKSLLDAIREAVITEHSRRTTHDEREQQSILDNALPSLPYDFFQPRSHCQHLEKPKKAPTDNSRCLSYIKLFLYYYCKKSYGICQTRTPLRSPQYLSSPYSTFCLDAENKIRSLYAPNYGNDESD